MSETSTSELYKTIGTKKVATESYYEDKSAAHPFEPTGKKAQAMVSEEKPGELDKGIKLPFVKQKTPLVFEKISGNHGRNMTEAISHNRVIWGGEYAADIYGSRDFKGANMVAVETEYDEAAPFRVHTFGLMDSTGVERTIQASEVLRKNGLPTEKTVKIRKLDQIIVKKANDPPEKGKKVFVEQWKDMELNERKKLIINSQNEVDRKYYSDIYDQTKAYLESTDFYVLERDMQVSERLGDIAEANSEEDFNKIVNSVFKWVNTATKVKGNGIIPDTPVPREFHNNDEDIRRYFGEWLPSQMGIYLGRLHNLDLAHGFPHWQNWSMVGTLYDLDSIKGPKLGDEPNREWAFVTDVQYCLQALTQQLGKKANEKSYVSNHFDNLNLEAVATFTASYVKEKFGPQNQEGLAKIKEVYFKKLYDGMGYPEEVWEKVKAKLGEEPEKILV